MNRIYLILLFLFIHNCLFGSAKIDSLQNVTESDKHDTLRCEAYVLWGENVYYNDPDQAVDLWQQCITCCEDSKSKNFSERVQRKLQAIKADAINDIGYVYDMQGNLDEALKQYHKSYKIQLDIKDYEGMATSLNNIGYLYKNKGAVHKAIEYYNKSLKIRKRQNNLNGIANSYNNLGSIYLDLGYNTKALDLFNKSLKIREKFDKGKDYAVALNNIAFVYSKQGNYDKALTLFEESIQIAQDLKDHENTSSTYNNIGNLKKRLKKFDEAITCYQKSVDLSHKIGDVNGEATARNNLGMIYANQNKYYEALKCYEQSLKLFFKLESKPGEARSYINMGNIYFQLDQIEKSKKYAHKALAIAKKIGYPEIYEGAAHLLHEVEAKLGNHDKSLRYYKEYIVMRDSIKNQRSKRIALKNLLKYQYERAAAEDSVKNSELQKIKDAQLLAEKAEKEKLQSESKQLQLKSQKEKQFRYFLFGSLGLALVFGGFIFNRFRVTRKQKNIIEEQKSEVDEAYTQLEVKNNEILDSIAYAKRIQTAILPPTSKLNQAFSDYFVMYRPKDIVAGDFYWLEQQKGKTLLAVGDCTGHGVPGAMVSVICNNGLNRTVREQEIIKPGQILDKTRSIVLEQFEKSSEKVNDGMDIALVSIAHKNQSQSGPTIEYAGAHNPLWIVTKKEKQSDLVRQIEKKYSVFELSDASDYCLIEVKADKQPIGKFGEAFPFVTQQMTLSEGDAVYIFTDGFPDQFGGANVDSQSRKPGGKKLKTKNFKKLILTLQEQNMPSQKYQLNKFFDEWRGDFEQLDDVCVIGVRL